MNNHTKLSRNTQIYMDNYYSILDTMIERMTSQRPTDSISNDFIVRMIPHHRAAIEMSNNLLNFSNYAPLRKIAENIIKEQTKSIRDMEKILRHCKTVKNTNRDMQQYQQEYSKIALIMFTKMKNTPVCNNVNINFIKEMIPHHEGAIRMSQSALKFDICDRLIPILQAIIQSQRKGISEMRILLEKLEKNNGCM